MDRSTNDIFDYTYGGVFNAARQYEGLRLIRSFNDPQYRQRHHSTAEFPTAEHYAAWVVGTQLTDGEVLRLHQMMAADNAPHTGPFRSLMGAPIAQRAADLQRQAAVGPSSRVPSAPQLTFIDESTRARDAALSGTATPQRSATQPLKKQRTAAIANALEALKSELREGEFADENLINDIAGKHKVQYPYLRTLAREEGLYEGRQRFKLKQSAIREGLHQPRRRWETPGHASSSAAGPSRS